MKSVIAFDVSMGHSYMVIYDARQHCIFEGEITHGQSSFEEVRTRIEAQRKQDGILPDIMFETTDVYSKALERFMQACGFEYALINPLEAKRQRLAMRIHKADRSDAHKLAQACLTHPSRNKQIQDIYYEEMRSLSRHYAELEKEVVRLRSRMHPLVQMTFPKLEAHFNRASDLYLSILQLFPNLKRVTALSRTKVNNQILNSTGKWQSRKRGEEKADSLMMVAADV